MMCCKLALADDARVFRVPTAGRLRGYIHFSCVPARHAQGEVDVPPLFSLARIPDLIGRGYDQYIAAASARPPAVAARSPICTGTKDDADLKPNVW